MHWRERDGPPHAPTEVSGPGVGALLGRQVCPKEPSFRQEPAGLRGTAGGPPGLQNHDRLAFERLCTAPAESGPENPACLPSQEAAKSGAAAERKPNLSKKKFSDVKKQYDRPA